VTVVMTLEVLQVLLNVVVSVFCSVHLCLFCLLNMMV
jgi:hypothetical protein